MKSSYVLILLGIVGISFASEENANAAKKKMIDGLHTRWNNAADNCMSFKHRDINRVIENEFSVLEMLTAAEVQQVLNRANKQEKTLAGNARSKNHLSCQYLGDHFDSISRQVDIASYQQKQLIDMVKSLKDEVAEFKESIEQK